MSAYADPDATGEPDVSFIIPVRDDERRLRACLESLRANAYPAQRVEIVVVDNGSRDRSADVARDLGARVATVTGTRVSQLRNAGAALARGRILAFVDADHLLAPGWIGAAVEGCGADPSIGAVGSLCLAPNDGTWVQRAYDRLRGRTSGRQPVDWLGAGNLVVTRLAFEAVGGFDSSLDTCEDVDLCKRLRRAGYVLVSDDRLVNVHVGDPPTLAALFRGELWRGRSNLAVSFRPPVTMGELPSAVVPVVQLAGVIAAASAIALGGAEYAVLALASVLPLALVPAARAVRMSRRAGRFEVGQFADNAVVAFVYDCARALALVSFAGHTVRRR